MGVAFIAFMVFAILLSFGCRQAHAQDSTSALKNYVKYFKGKDIDTLEIEAAGWPDTITVVLSQRELDLRAMRSGGDTWVNDYYGLPLRRPDGKVLRRIPLSKVGHFYGLENKVGKIGGIGGGK